MFARLFVSQTSCSKIYFFFKDTASTVIYTLSLHDALPISPWRPRPRGRGRGRSPRCGCRRRRDRKSTRLNSSHSQISYAVFCLKKITLTSCCTNDFVLTFRNLKLSESFYPPVTAVNDASTS